MGLYDFFMGTPESVERIPRYSPEQNDILNKMMSGLGENPDRQFFSSFEQPLMSQYQNEIVPHLKEVLPQGSGLEQQLAKAGTSLQERLGEQRGRMGLEAAMMQRDTPVFRPSQEGALSAFGKGFSGVAGGALASYLTGRITPFMGALGKKTAGALDRQLGGDRKSVV